MTAQDLWDEYIDNVADYVLRVKSNGKYPNERLMRSIEIELGIAEQAVDDHRRNMFAIMMALQQRGHEFQWLQDDKLRAALEKVALDCLD